MTTHNFPTAHPAGIAAGNKLWQFIKKFVRSYESGITPNPCIDCNRYMNFDKLFERAEILGCKYVVTGHYARIGYENGRFVLKKALDEAKDQSYVLYSMTQEQLAHTLFPLGNLEKAETRHIPLQGEGPLPAAGTVGGCYARWRKRCSRCV